MTRVLIVAVNVCRGLVHRRAVYVWAAAVLLMLLRSGASIFGRNPNVQMMNFFRANAISASLDTWALLALAAAIFLGAASVSGEKTHKTIATVLSRPMHRWELLVGHWLGVTAFSIVSLLIGLALATVLAAYMGISIDPRHAAMALAQTTGGIMLFAAVGIAIGSNTSVAIAASITVLLAFMPTLVTILRNDVNPVQHYSGLFLGYVTPPGPADHYQGVAWSEPPAVLARSPIARRPQIDYGESSKRLLTNVSYGLMYFAIGSVVFTRRDLTLG